MSNTAKECRDTVRDDYIVVDAKSYAMPGWLKDLLTTAANEIDRLDTEIERAKQERNKIGMEIRREWMAKCSALQTQLTHAAARLEQAESTEPKVCRWIADDYGNWNTECGGIFEITNGTPQDNKMSFCPYCGGKVKIV